MWYIHSSQRYCKNSLTSSERAAWIRCCTSGDADRSIALSYSLKGIEEGKQAVLIALFTFQPLKTPSQTKKDHEETLCCGSCGRVLGATGFLLRAGWAGEKPAAASGRSQGRGEVSKQVALRSWLSSLRCGCGPVGHRTLYCGFCWLKMQQFHLQHFSYLKTTTSSSFPSSNCKKGEIH